MNTLQLDPDDLVQVLDKDGHVVEGASPPNLDEDTLVDMYRTMRLSRHFAKRAVSLQRQGRMGTFPPIAGQEASQVASALALHDEDWVFPSYRETAVLLARGLSMKRTYLYWMGHEYGNQMPEDANIFSVAVSIATQIPHATGAAWASKLQGEDKAFVCYFGDGATSEGDFHEALNFGGVFDLPCIYFCNNNQWAISVPRERQTASETIAQKAIAYGFEGVRVDGMDPLAVYKVTKAALSRARDPPEGELRPTLIEAVQYRFGAHTTADDPSVYRSDSEVEKWKRRDPIPRMETFLRETGRLDDEDIVAIEDAIESEVAEAIEAAEDAPRPSPDDIFDFVYEEPTERVADGKEYLRQLRERHGDDVLLED